MDELDDLLEGLPEDLSGVKEKTSVSKRANRKNARYTGPITVFLENEYKFPDGYDPEILEFKEFIDELGRNGVTFETLFKNAEDYVDRTGNKEFEPDRIRHKFFQINSKNTLTLKWIKNIAGLLGYNVELHFLGRDGTVSEGSMFSSTTELE